MIFGFDITPIQIIVLEVSAAATLVSLVLFLLKVLPVARRRAACDKTAGGSLVSVGREGVSIIVYSSDHAAANLELLLPRLLEQEYDGEYEVIVVNEGDSARVRGVVDALRVRHNNIYLTHTPDGAHHLSRKKLAVTLGIKAARYPVAVFTTATAVISSSRWLALMTRHFSPDSHIEVVLGYATADPYEDTSLGARTRSFDYVADSTMWLGDAIKGHPWRGTEHNLAYRRDLFFRSKGFSSHLNLRDGDDDIFISRIATASNTAVELSLESIVEVPGENLPAVARRRAWRRNFTKRFIKNRPRLLAAASWWCYALGGVSAVVALALPPYDTPAAVAGLIALAIWYPVGLVWRRATNALCGRRLMLTLPLLAATYPLRSAFRQLYALRRHGKRYTWE